MHHDALLKKIEDRTAVVGVIGLGYVGLPLCLAIVEAGFAAVGFDIDPEKPRAIAEGRSYIKHIKTESVTEAVKRGRFSATTDFSRLAEVDAILLCVPTPLTRHNEPDLTYVVKTTETVAKYVRPGQLIVLESTTYPGTTVEIVAPLLAKSGLAVGLDLFVAFSPEREDPGNPDFSTKRIPKVVGGIDAASGKLADALYGKFVSKTVVVSSASTAEAVKLTENIFRAVNIALVNELKLIYGRMGIDVWEVIEAAKTKPFGYMPFYPGPGLGGHCIPIDPFYLTWKAKEFGMSTRFIELAGEINTLMPQHVVNAVALALDKTRGKGLNGSSVLVLGLSYKKNIDDIRESPSLRLLEMLEERGAKVAYHDPFVSSIMATREHPTLTGRKSVPFDAKTLAGFDAVLISTDHDAVDYGLLAEHARLIVDTRNAMGRHGLLGDKIVQA